MYMIFANREMTFRDSNLMASVASVGGEASRKGETDYITAAIRY